MPNAALPQSFYARDTVAVAQALIGATLVCRQGRHRCAGVIVETEAYRGADDPASHAAGGMTSRNRAMFGPAGRAYVYLIYGIHCCFNVVTERAGEPGAVLIRAVAPTEGLGRMRRRRGGAPDRGLASGPGKLCAAFGLDRRDSGRRLTSTTLFIEAGPAMPFEATTRVGISRARDRTWRYVAKGSPWVSQGKPS